MSNVFDNLWAQEMAIDVEELQKERPTHPDQIVMRKKTDKQSADYWAYERFLAQLGDGVELPEPEMKIPVKRTRVRRYEFTDTQLEIALRSLNEKGSM